MQYLSERLQAIKGGEARGAAAKREGIAAQQRRRLLAATEEQVAERGFAGATVEGIARAAHVSSVTFYEHFSGKEEIFVAAFDAAVEETRVALAAAVSSALPWPDQVREGMRALLAEIAARPARARMCLVEGPKGGPLLLGRYEAMLDATVPKLHEGRLQGFVAKDLPAAQEEATAAGVAWLLRERLEAGTEAIEESLDELVEVALAPYAASSAVGG